RPDRPAAGRPGPGHHGVLYLHLDLERLLRAVGLPAAAGDLAEVGGAQWLPGCPGRLRLRRDVRVVRGLAATDVRGVPARPTVLEQGHAHHRAEVGGPSAVGEALEREGAVRVERRGDRREPW